VDCGSEGFAMTNMEVWDWLLLGGALYVALTSLVVLMRRRRDEVLAELEAQAHVERERRRQAELAEQQKQKRQKRAA
jgi:hypothetical protein